jgi:hypothetical protein
VELARHLPRQHSRNGSLSVDDTFLETVRFVEDQTGGEVVKRDPDLSRRSSDHGREPPATA